MTEAFNIDCMDAMAQMKDNEFDLAIVDPPYGIGADSMRLGKGVDFVSKGWDNERPTKEYFAELGRVAKNRIIWGGNHFELLISRGWVYWDKMQDGFGKDFSSGELAWTSFDIPMKQIRYKYQGNYEGYENSITTKSSHPELLKIHPTQKPVALYKWLLKNYAKEGDRILDTHLGSGSSRIAAHDMGFDFTGYEIDKDYFKAQELRFNNHIKQGSLFNPKDMYT